MATDICRNGLRVDWHQSSSESGITKIHHKMPAGILNLWHTGHEIWIQDGIGDDEHRKSISKREIDYMLVVETRLPMG